MKKRKKNMTDDNKEQKETISFYDANLYGYSLFKKADLLDLYHRNNHSLYDKIECEIHFYPHEYLVESIMLSTRNIWTFLILVVSEVDRYGNSSYAIFNYSDAQDYLDVLFLMKEIIEEKYELNEEDKIAFEEARKLNQAFQEIIDLHNKAFKSRDKQKKLEYELLETELTRKLIEQSIYGMIKESFIKTYDHIKGLKQC